MRRLLFGSWICLAVLLAGTIGAGAQAQGVKNLLKNFGRSSEVEQGKMDPNVQRAMGATSAKWNQVVAEVDGESITLEQLADDLIATRGKEHIETMINRKLVEQACRKNGISITNADLEAEIGRKLKELNVSRREFANIILSKQKISFSQYVRDTIWPSVALTKLVKDQVQVTEEDLNKAFEANFGEKVQFRMFLTSQRGKATDCWEEVQEIEDPELRSKKFSDWCKTFSEDQATKPFGGLCQPLHRHSSFPTIEKKAFSLKEGEQSEVFQVREGYLVLYCEHRLTSRTKEIDFNTVVNEKTGETVREKLRKDIGHKKLRQQVAIYFQKLLEQNESKIQDYLNGKYQSGPVRPASHSEKGSERIPRQ